MLGSACRRPYAPRNVTNRRRASERVYAVIRAHERRAAVRRAGNDPDSDGRPEPAIAGESEEWGVLPEACAGVGGRVCFRPVRWARSKRADP